MVSRLVMSPNCPVSAESKSTTVEFEFMNEPQSLIDN